MSRIKVNSISNRLDEGPPELTFGATIPSGGIINSNGGINVGVATVGTITATSLSATTVTATSFVGDGSQLSGLPIASLSKIIALKIIMDPLPFRS